MRVERLDSSETLELFAAGNYASVAMRGDPNQWQTYAALGLVGKTEDALAGLKDFERDEARFYSGVSLWIDGQDGAAARILQAVPTAHAEYLLKLISKQRINVLAQWPWFRRGAQDIVTGAQEDPKFRVRNISFYPGDIRNKPYADVHSFYNPADPPDLYTCMAVEWHVIPPNIQELPCPILGHTADYDIHIQAVYPWLQLFDELVVSDHTEWGDACGLVRIPVSTFPKTFGIMRSLSPLSNHEREIDVFMSGSLLHPYFVTKPALLAQVFSIPGLKPLAINGFISDEEYADLLSRSKVCFTRVRHPGAMPTRGLEALGMGCAVVVQKESVLTLYAGESEGLITYTVHDLSEAIEQVLREWKDFEQRARRGSQIIRREFALVRVASQYLRFLTFVATKPREPRIIQSQARLKHKRTIVRKGWIIGGADTYAELRRGNLDHWAAKQTEDSSAGHFIDMAREIVLGHAEQNGASGAGDKLEPIEQAIAIQRTGLERFPQCLVLRFNLMRTAMHFGSPEEVSEAIKLAETTLDASQSDWTVELMDDVFPWDFFSSFFNYRCYFDLVTEGLTRGKNVKQSLAKLIFASMHYYLGHYKDCPDHFSMACEFDPDFPFFRMGHAMQLLRGGGEDDHRQAVRILEALASDSLLFREAYSVLAQLQIRGSDTTPKFAQLTRKVDLCGQCCVFSEIIGIEELRPSSHCANDPVSARHKLAKRKERENRTLLSIILVSGSRGADPRYVLNSLWSGRSKDRSKYEIVWVDFFEPVPSEIMERADTIVVCDKKEIFNRHGAYNAGILNASGQVLTLWDMTEHFPANFADRVRDAFNLDSKGYPDELVVRHTPGSSVSFRKIDAIRFGGFDESELFHGISDDSLDLHRRLMNAGIPERVCPLDDAYVTASGELFTSPIISEVVKREHVDRRYRGRIFPLKENAEIKELRISMRGNGSLSPRESADGIHIGDIPEHYGATLSRQPTAVGFHLTGLGTRVRNSYVRFRSAAAEALKRNLGSRRYEALRRTYCVTRDLLRWK